MEASLKVHENQESSDGFSRISFASLLGPSVVLADSSVESSNFELLLSFIRVSRPAILLEPIAGHLKKSCI